MPAGNFPSVNKIFYKVSKVFKDDKGHDNIAILQGSKEELKLYSYLEGTLIGIESFEGEYEGQKTFRIKFVFSDENTEEWLECGRYTGFTRDVLNCLSNLDSITQVRLTPFLSEDEATGKKYARGSVRVGPDFSKKDSKVEKRFKGKEIPKIVPVVVNGKPLMVGGKQVLDDSELQQWTDDLIAVCQTKIKAVPAPTQKQETHEVEDDGDKF